MIHMKIEVASLKTVGDTPNMAFDLNFKKTRSLPHIPSH